MSNMAGAICCACGAVEETGACCLPIPFGCAELAEQDCIDQGGVFQGPGTTCEPDPCCIVQVGLCACETDPCDPVIYVECPDWSSPPAAAVGNCCYDGSTEQFVSGTPPVPPVTPVDQPSCEECCGDLVEVVLPCQPSCIDPTRRYVLPFCDPGHDGEVFRDMQVADGTCNQIVPHCFTRTGNCVPPLPNDVNVSIDSMVPNCNDPTCLFGECTGVCCEHDCAEDYNVLIGGIAFEFDPNACGVDWTSALGFGVRQEECLCIWDAEGHPCCQPCMCEAAPCPPGQVFPGCLNAGGNCGICVRCGNLESSIQCIPQDNLWRLQFVVQWPLIPTCDLACESTFRFERTFDVIGQPDCPDGEYQFIFHGGGCCGEFIGNPTAVVSGG